MPFASSRATYISDADRYRKSVGTFGPNAVDMYRNPGSGIFDASMDQFMPMQIWKSNQDQLDSQQAALLRSIPSSASVVPTPTGSGDEDVIMDPMEIQRNLLAVEMAEQGIANPSQNEVPFNDPIPELAEPVALPPLPKKKRNSRSISVMDETRSSDEEEEKKVKVDPEAAKKEEEAYLESEKALIAESSDESDFEGTIKNEFKEATPEERDLVSKIVHMSGPKAVAKFYQRNDIPLPPALPPPLDKATMPQEESDKRDPYATFARSLYLDPIGTLESFNPGMFDMFRQEMIETQKDCPNVRILYNSGLVRGMVCMLVRATWEILGKQRTNQFREFLRKTGSGIPDSETEVALKNTQKQLDDWFAKMAEYALRIIETEKKSASWEKGFWLCSEICIIAVHSLNHGYYLTEYRENGVHSGCAFTSEVPQPGEKCYKFVINSCSLRADFEGLYDDVRKPGADFAELSKRASQPPPSIPKPIPYTYIVKRSNVPGEEDYYVRMLDELVTFFSFRATIAYDLKKWHERQAYGTETRFLSIIHDFALDRAFIASVMRKFCYSFSIMRTITEFVPRGTAAV